MAGRCSDIDLATGLEPSSRCAVTDGDRASRQSIATRAAAAAAVTRTLLARLRFIDAQWATSEVLAVQRLNGARGIRIRHFDEAEATRLARVPIVHERKRLDRSVRREQGAHRVLGGGEGEISNIKFGHE